jgi:hypothetical protein
MLWVVASIVVEAVIASLAALVVAKHPVATGNEVISGQLPHCGEAGAVADGLVRVSHFAGSLGLGRS